MIQIILYVISAILFLLGILCYPYLNMISQHKTKAIITYTSCVFNTKPETPLLNSTGVPYAYHPYTCTGNLKYKNKFGMDKETTYINNYNTEPKLPMTETLNEFQPNPDAAMFALVPISSFIMGASIVLVLAKLVPSN